MPQPPTTPVMSRELVRLVPFTAQNTVRNTNAGAAQAFVAAFDVGIRTTDPNQMIGGFTGANPSADPTQQAIGTLLDAAIFCTGVGGGTLVLEIAIDATCTYRTVANPITVTQNILANIAGYRVTGRFVRVTFTNVTAAATVEFGAYIRSQ